MPATSYISRPNLAKESAERLFPPPRQLVHNGELSVLNVAGDSKIEAAFCELD
ncbi:hypothetical protein [Streptomyces sp. uw30]|uniref:hypothetical protein n=1 Tax=Streptomyces sp. uw30 TaxID=1828179 RepID=UPI0016512BDA